jgi:putative ABC transport system permease protein
MLKHLSLIFKNTFRNKRRTLLTVFSIAASLCLLGVLMAMYHAFYFSDPSPEQALRLITRNRVSLTTVIPSSYREKIRQVEGVREVLINQWFGGTYKDARDFRNMFARFAVEPGKIFTVYPEYRVPEDQKRAFQRERTACIVGRGLVTRLGFQPGDRITLVGDIFPVKLELVVRGIYDARRDNENLFFHYDYLTESLPAGVRDSVSTFSILADRPESVPRIAREIDDMFRNSPAETRTESERAFELSFLAYLGNVKLFLLTIAGAVTFTLLLVSANTMAMSVRERAREVGILKTLGFAKGSILALMIGEAVLIALTGGAIGLVLAEAICSFIRRGPILFVDLKALSVPPEVVALGLGLAILIGIASSLLPAWAAARRPIVEALRFAD